MNSATQKFLFVETGGHTLSFAVSLIDDFSKQRIIMGGTKVFLKKSGIKAIKNPSGYFIFMDLPGSDFQTRIENKYYFEKEVNVTISELDLRFPVVSAILKPNYIYPFPTGSSLIRGSVYDQDLNTPIPAASVQIHDTPISCICDSQGRFALYFGPMTEDDIEVQNSHRYIKVNDNTALGLRIEHPGYGHKDETIGKIEEGKTRLLMDKIFLKQV